MGFDGYGCGLPKKTPGSPVLFPSYVMLITVKSKIEMCLIGHLQSSALAFFQEKHPKQASFYSCFFECFILEIISMINVFINISANSTIVLMSNQSAHYLLLMSCRGMISDPRTAEDRVWLHRSVPLTYCTFELVVHSQTLQL
jgi:hypothetical protein